MFCQNCGKEIPDGAVCSCQANFQQNPNQQYYQQNPNQQYNQYQQTPPPYAAADNSKIYSIISYLGILWLFGLFIEPEKRNPFVRFHVGQGIILSIFCIGANILSNLVFTPLFSLSLFTLFLIPLLNLAIWGATVALVVLGIINANNGVTKPLPVIGKLAFYK